MADTTLMAVAAERNTPRSNLLAAIKSLAARAESNPKTWGPAQVKAAQLDAISTFERAVLYRAEHHAEGCPYNPICTCGGR